jgi:cytochrome c peroxidase
LVIKRDPQEAAVRFSQSFFSTFSRTLLVCVALATFPGCDQSNKPAPTDGQNTTASDDGDPEVIPGGLPLGLDPYAAKVPADNLITPEKIELGKVLYFDPRLSKDDTISCASCHDPQKGYSNGTAFATGVGGAVGGRSAPVITNRLFSTLQFWDGRSPSLEDQALGPIQNPIEMAMSLDDVVAKIAKIPGYPELFNKAFGTPEVNSERIGKAIATFERTIVSGNSKFDRHENGDANALNESETRGLALFRGKAKCSVCHTGFNLTDEKYHNIGVGMDAAEPDPGRFAQTKKPEDTGAFKTGTLRDIVHSAPYFRDGSAKTLEEVVDFYDKGGTPNPHLSKNIFKLNLTDQEKKDLVAIMKAFTGDTRTVSKAPKLPGK